MYLVVHWEYKEKWVSSVKKQAKSAFQAKGTVHVTESIKSLKHSRY